MFLKQNKKSGQKLCYKQKKICCTFYYFKTPKTQLSESFINFPLSSIYPSINESATRLIPQISVEESYLINEYPQSSKETVSIYPSISEEVSAPDCEKLAEFSKESTLLTESQLLEYYKNEQLDFVDDFVDIFIQVIFSTYRINKLVLFFIDFGLSKFCFYLLNLFSKNWSLEIACTLCY